MPKRYSDRMEPTIYSHTSPQKIQRSQEQNQERAYIAASRRADRSIEARVQSARMASEVHKKHTGKALYVSEAIVLNEEVYEEVEDRFPRSYQLLGPQLQSSHVDADLKNRATVPEKSARDEHWLENKINCEFAKHFPHIDHCLSRRWSIASLLESTAQITNPTQGQCSSLASISPELVTDNSTLTPPILTPECESRPETPCSQATPGTKTGTSLNVFVRFNLDEPASTTDFPLEAKNPPAESGHNQSDVMDPTLFDQKWIYADPPPVRDLDSIYWGLGSQSNVSADDDFWNTFISDMTW